MRRTTCPKCALDVSEVEGRRCPRCGYDIGVSRVEGPAPQGPNATFDQGLILGAALLVVFGIAAAAAFLTGVWKP